MKNSDMANYPQQIGLWLLDMIFPVKCVVCGKLGEYVCRPCLIKIPIHKNWVCIGCQKSAPRGETCLFCQPDNPVDQLWVATDYNDKAVKKVISAFKYQFIPELVEPLADLIQRYIGPAGRRGASLFKDNPLLVPVPLHKIKFNHRGFNQSQKLAEAVGSRFLIEVAVGALTREKYKTAQADIENRDQRLENIKDQFGCPKPEMVVGRNIILVDDVCTTGATLNECARVLKQSGAKSVSAFVVARGG